VRIAEGANYRSQYDPLLLADSIELARLEGSGPELPADFALPYRAYLKRGVELATRALGSPALDRDSQRAFRRCVAAFLGGSSLLATFSMTTRRMAVPADASLVRKAVEPALPLRFGASCLKWTLLPALCLMIVAGGVWLAPGARSWGMGRSFSLGSAPW